MTEEEKLADKSAEKYFGKPTELVELWKVKSYKDAFLAGLNKANEWHYVKDGDLPKDEDWKWCISRRGYLYIAKYEEMFGCWTNQEYKEVMCPYAWKEIVLPKEIE